MVLAFFCLHGEQRLIRLILLIFGDIDKILKDLENGDRTINGREHEKKHGLSEIVSKRANPETAADSTCSSNSYGPPDIQILFRLLLHCFDSL